MIASSVNAGTKGGFFILILASGAALLHEFKVLDLDRRASCAACSKNPEEKADLAAHSNTERWLPGVCCSTFLCNAGSNAPARAMKLADIFLYKPTC